MNINQLSEQLKDVPQNRLVDYAKNPNSVVPQFLALAEIQRRQQLSAQTQPPAATVAEDVLTQAQPAPMMQQQQPQQQPMAQQLPENQPGVAQLQANVAPQGFAGGGIVAFAGGGLQDDDKSETEDEELSRLFKSGLSFDEIASAIPAGVRGLLDKLPKSYEATKAAQSTSTPRGSHKYEQAVLEEANRQGVDPNLALHVLYKETGNLKDPETARSKAGAIGIMQLMPKTAADLGVDPTNPMENIRGGITYLKQMADKYKENRLAAAAYNAGPGNLDRALRRQGGLDTLPHETRNYIAGLAQGGDVRKFATGDYVGFGEELPYDPSSSWNITQGVKDWWNKNTPGTKEFIEPAQPKKIETEIAPNFGVKDASTWEDVAPKTHVTKEQMGPPAIYGKLNSEQNDSQTEAPKSKAELLMEQALADINARAEKAKESGDMNAYLALMQAGLGMMASKSPYALGGIGEGGQQGVSTYAALRKQQADEEKDIMGARLGLTKYGLAAENAQKELELKQKIYGTKEGQVDEAALERKREFNQKQVFLAQAEYRKYEDQLKENFQKQYPIPMPKDPGYQAALREMQNDPVLKELYAQAFPNLAKTQPTTPIGAVKQYNPTTGKVE